LSIVEKVNARLGEQTIESVDSTAGQLSLSGKLLASGTPPRNTTGRASDPAPLGYRLSLTSIDDVTLELALDLEAEEGVWAQLAWASRPGSAKFGFGVQFSHVNLAGRRVPLLTAEQGVGRG